MTARPVPRVVSPTLPVKGPYIMHSAVSLKLLVLAELFHVLKRLYLRHTALLSLILLYLSMWIALPVAEELLSPLLLLILVLLAFWQRSLLIVLLWTSWWSCKQIDILRFALVAASEVSSRVLMCLPLEPTLCTVDKAFVVFKDTWVVEALCVLFIKLFRSESKQLNH